VLPGHAYIAPGGLHLSVERSGANYIARVRDGEPVNRHKPSVEVLFESAARVVGPNALGVMLTGMGADGARAMRAMRDAGSWNLCQDEASCVVFGMPREAIAHGAAHEVLPLAQIAPASDRAPAQHGGRGTPTASEQAARALSPGRRRGSENSCCRSRQEVEAAHGGRAPGPKSRHRPMRPRPGQRGVQHGRQRQAGALAKKRPAKPFAQAQRVEHELERQLARATSCSLDTPCRRQRVLHVGRRLAPAHLAHDAVRETQLAVRAGADAQVVAELPVVQVVPQRWPGRAKADTS
jgi:hypothetical protein